MWHEICDYNDLSSFMDEMCYFHDSCIKEMKYLSGAYVADDLSMHPINDKRVLKFIVQRQFKRNAMIEMEFEGLKYVKMFPVDDRYTCEIQSAALLLKDECVYWCDCGDVSEAELDSYDGTVICAAKLRWRSIEGRMGEREFYHSTV